MSKSVKILILILTILPILLLFGGYIYFGIFISMFAEMATHLPKTPEMPFPTTAILVFMGSFMFAALVGCGMLIFYIVNLIQTNRVPRDLKPVWGILFFLGWWVASIVYWFLYIWPEPAASPEPTTSIPPPSEHHPQP